MRSCFDECVVKLNSHPSINKNIYILVEKHITPPQAVVQKGVYASLATQIYLQPKVKNTGEIIES